MPKEEREVTPQEGVEMANRVGLNSVNWNGSMLTLVLKDGSSMGFVLVQHGEGFKMKTRYIPNRLERTPTESY